MIIAAGAAGALVGALLPIIGIIVSSTATIIAALIASGRWSPGQTARIKSENQRLRRENRRLRAGHDPDDDED